MTLNQEILTIEVNESSLSSSFLYRKFVTLMKSENKFYRRKILFVLNYHAPYKHIYPERYSHLLFLFFHVQAETQLVCEIDRTYTSKLFVPGVLDICYAFRFR